MSETVKFGSMEAADRVREQHSEYLCPVDDDRRQKTVAFVSDTSETLLQRIEAEAVEDRAADSQRSNTEPLTDRERDKISDLNGFSRSNTTFTWRSAKGVFTREGLGDQFRNAIGYLTDYGDPAEGAEQYVREYQEGGSGGGSRDVGEEDITGRQRQQQAAATEQEEGCDHARNVCQRGDPDACEFLTEACGYDDEEADRILGTEDSASDAAPDEITGKAAGALSRSWQGYKGAIAQLGEALDSAREAWENADQAAEAINGIRDQHGQDAIHFNALEAANADLLDLTRMAAADCHECHADHSDHDHAVDSDALEDLREFADAGAPSTPVGTSDATDEQLAERAPGQRPEPEGRPPSIDATPDYDSPSRDRLDAVAEADSTADDSTPDGSPESLAKFGVDPDEGRDGPSEEHRRSQNNGYLRSGSRGLDEETSAREGLGRFAATGGEKTLDQLGEETADTTRESPIDFDKTTIDPETRPRRKFADARYTPLVNDRWADWTDLSAHPNLKAVKPWIMEVTGTHPKYGLDGEWLNKQKIDGDHHMDVSEVGPGSFIRVSGASHNNKKHRLYRVVGFGDGRMYYERMSKSEVLEQLE